MTHNKVFEKPQGIDQFHDLEIDRKNLSYSKLSIVISGWPAVGKTTMASRLAEEFDLQIYNGGDILKMLARDKGYTVNGKDWWDTDQARNFMNERKSNSSFDKEVDKKLTDLVKAGRVVITSYTLPWLVRGPITFWLKGSVESRANRMSSRDNIDIVTARKIVLQRDRQNVVLYKKLYGFTFGEDLGVFDYSLNTDQLSLDSLIEISKTIVRHVMK